MGLQQAESGGDVAPFLDALAGLAPSRSARAGRIVLSASARLVCVGPLRQLLRILRRLRHAAWSPRHLP